MNHRSPSEAALRAIWQVMVEMVEDTNDDIVMGQRLLRGDSIQAVSEKCLDLALLAHAAAMLAKRTRKP